MRIPAVFVCAALAVGCKGKPTTQDPPAKVGSAATQPSTNPSSADVKLPERTTTPPNKTTKMLTPDELKSLGEVTFPGFTAEGKLLRETYVVVIQKMVGHPTLAAGVTIRTCADPSIKCMPMDLEQWKASPKIKELLPLDLQSQPDTHFEIGMTDINGQPVVFTYQYGMNFSNDESGRHGRWSHAYILYYNDGNNWIRIVSEFKDLPPPTLAEMIKQVTRDDLEKLGKSMMDFYTHKW